MSFSCGIIGLPNSGKSTIFNALTTLSVPSQPYPFCTIDPNIGIVPVPDDRLTELARLVKPEIVTPTTIEFIDVAGLIKDAHKGEGCGNRFLSHIRNVDAIAHVVRCFRAENVPHVYADINAVRDIEIVETEILISDLEIVEERLKKIERIAKVSKEKNAEEQEMLFAIKGYLERGSFIEMEQFSDEQRAMVASFNLIASKPFFYIANIDEGALGDTQETVLKVFPEYLRKKVVSICGKLEEELVKLSDEERISYMELYGLKGMSIGNIVKVGYDILDLITFYTVVGSQMRAWTVKQGTPAARAAGKIHSDMERGFIKAEVITYDDFIRCGSEHAVREKGLARIEGKDYIVHDGDILHIRFNV